MNLKCRENIKKNADLQFTAFVAKENNSCRVCKDCKIYVYSTIYYHSNSNIILCVHVFSLSERNVRRMTRALKHTVLQQQVIDVDKALQILDEEPPLVVDRDKLKVWDTVVVCVCWLILHSLIDIPVILVFCFLTLMEAVKIDDIVFFL